MDAEDLKIFVALARERRLTRVAAQLGLAHTTVGRRVARMEADVGQRLFDRLPSGWSLTPEGKVLLVPALAATEALADFEDMLQAPSASLAGTVRIICPDAFGLYLVTPALPRLLGRHRGINVELNTTTQRIDSLIADCDIAITMERPPVAGLATSWHLTRFTNGLYAADDYLAQSSDVKTEDDLEDHFTVGFVDRRMNVPPLQSIQHVFSRAPTVQCDNVGLQIRAIRAGVGIGSLPIYVAEEEGLTRVLPAVRFPRDYWVTVANAARRIGRVQEVLRFLSEVVESRRAQLESS